MPASFYLPVVRGVIRCGYCGHPIVLPFATLELNAAQEWWPNGRDWLYLACPECRRIAAHARCSNETLRRQDLVPDRLLIRISYLCPGISCAVPVQFHIFGDTTIIGATNSRLRDLIEEGYWTGLTPCGHAIGRIGDQEIRFDVIHGGSELLGCNRKT